IGSNSVAHAEAYTVEDTVAFQTILDTVAGDDTVTILGTGGALTINTGQGNDAVHVGGTHGLDDVGGDLKIDLGTGTGNSVTVSDVGSLATKAPVKTVSGNTTTVAEWLGDGTGGWVLQVQSLGGTRTETYTDSDGNP